MNAPHSVWKFDLELKDLQAVDMPRGAQLLHVDVQFQGVAEHAKVWALVEPAQPTARRLISVHGTGHFVNRMASTTDPVGTLPEYVSSFDVNGGLLVFHVFDHGEV